MVIPEIEHQNSAARSGDPRRLGHRTRGIRRVVQRLRQQRHLYGVVLDRQFLELALPPDNVGARAAGRARAHGRGRLPSGRPPSLSTPIGSFNREVSFTAAEVRHRHRRKEMAEHSRPGGPAASGTSCRAVPAVGVPVEVLLAEPHHLLQPGPSPSRPGRSSSGRTDPAARPRSRESAFVVRASR